MTVVASRSWQVTHTGNPLSSKRTLMSSWMAKLGNLRTMSAHGRFWMGFRKSVSSAVFLKGVGVLSVSNMRPYYWVAAVVCVRCHHNARRRAAVGAIDGS